MKAIGTGLDAGTDNSALEVSEFGRRILRDQIKFLNRIRRRRITQQVV